MKVRDVMRAPAVSISTDASYEEAARLMHRNRFSGLPVIDDAGRLVGIVSEKDLFRAIYPNYEEFCSNPEICLDQEAREAEIESIRGRPVRDFMTRGVITIGSASPVLQAGGLMLARGLHRLPVVDDGRLVGIVTRREIYRAILQQRLAIEPPEAIPFERPKRVQNQ